MATIYDWSTTASSNSSAGTPINWAENQAPSTVNNSSRELMKQVADWRNLISGAKITATADTMTLTSGLSLAAYAQGMQIAVEIGVTNTNAVTINIDSLGAKAIVKNYNVALVAGDLVAGMIVILSYEATAGNFQLLTPGARQQATLVGTETLTNKSLTSPALTGTLSGDAFLDEDAMGSDSATKVASQQSIKTYVDAAASSVDADGAAESAAAALVSENNTATSETNAATSETNSQTYANQALAAAQGWAAVVTLTNGTTNIETTDARTFYIVDASGGTVTINLPAIGANDGLSYHFQASNVDSAITIVRDGTDYINGVSGNYTGLTEVAQTVALVGDDATPDNWVLTSLTAVQAASTTQAGIVELATDAEVVTGTDTARAVTPASIAAQYSTKARTITADTSTALNSALSHEGGVVTMNNASANVFTIEPNATIAHSTGAQIDVIMLGAGVTSITADTGVTLNGVSAGTGALTRYQACTLVRLSSDVWVAPALGTVA